MYYPFLLISKKRYAGLIWTNDKTYDKMDTKGIETVRLTDTSSIPSSQEAETQRQDAL